MRHRISIIVALAILTALTSTAAAQDGGTRSVFAQGAGTRATSMGGAFAAIADDASAPVWNASGLSQLRRYELHASHTNLYGLGFNEQYAFVAVPTERWGVAGVTFRHFGVSGIEQRDLTNALVSDDLSRNESEIAVAYGHAFADGWALGGALKINHVGFGGFSDNGLGLDFGIMAHPGRALHLSNSWTHRVRLGLAVRNLIEPSVRLDQDSVNDPAVVRVGTSYDHAFSRGRSLLVGVDVEKSRGVGARFAAGAEFHLHPDVALRTGFTHAGFTTGAGFTWRDFTFDYAFEGNEFDSVQRAGVSMKFGTSVDDRRQARLEAEERAVQKRLADEYAKRQVVRLRELVAEAETAHAMGRLEDALDYLETANAMQPGMSDVEALRARYRYDLARQIEDQGDYLVASMWYTRVLAIDPDNIPAQDAVERCRAESHRRSERSPAMRQRFAKGLDALATGDLASARDTFADIVEETGDFDGALMLERTEQAIASRVESSIAQVRRLIRSEQFDRAATLLEKTRAVAGPTTAIARAEKQLDDARADSQRRRIAEAARSIETAARGDAAIAATGLTPEDRAEIEELYRRGLETIERGRANEAIRYWEIVWSRDPDYERVSEYLNREYLARGMEFFARRDLQEAITLWEQALKVAPDDLRTAEYLERARLQLARSEEIRSANDGVPSE